MLLTLSTTHRPATDLGFLLHKHPERLHSQEFSFGEGHVFYPDVRDDLCTAALVLDIDHPKFKPGLDRLVRIANDTAAAKAQGGIVGGVKKLLCNLDAGLTFARLYFLPAKPNEMPAEIRMAPVW